VDDDRRGAAGIKGGTWKHWPPRPESENIEEQAMTASEPSPRVTVDVIRKTLYEAGIIHARADQLAEKIAAALIAATPQEPACELCVCYHRLGDHEAAKRLRPSRARARKPRAMTLDEAWKEWCDSLPPQANYIYDPNAERDAFEAGWAAAKRLTDEQRAAIAYAVCAIGLVHSDRAAWDTHTPCPCEAERDTLRAMLAESPESEKP